MNNVIIGQKFGYVTVVSQSGRTIGKCHCICDCGKEFDTRRTYLLSGRVKSCGCKHDVVKYDITGLRFGRLVVLKKSKTRYSESGKSRMTMWTCVCDCGTMKDINSRALRSGATQSCGCFQKEQVSNILSNDYVGKRFGKLVVLNKVESWKPKSGRKQGIKSKWLCECDCGEFVEVLGTSLQCGDTRSCGCNHTSKLEDFTEQWLIDNNLILNKSYFKQVTFDDLRGLGGGLMPYDFMIKIKNETIIIECQGKQHYEPVKWFGGDLYFEKLKIHDKIKKDYALSHSFKYIEVSYKLNDYVSIENYLNSLNIL